MVSVGKIYDVDSSSNATTTSSNISPLNEDKRVELFHIRIISKHKKIDTLFDSGSQANLISANLVNKMGLETYDHPTTYPLGWLTKDTQ